MQAIARAPRRRLLLLLNPQRSPFYSSQLTAPAQRLRRLEEEGGKTVKVAVWWDFENCGVPAGVNVHRVSGRISAALRGAGVRGPVTVTAFGDVSQLSRATQEALVATGVSLVHVPHSGKNSSDLSIMAELAYWIAQNPPPAHFFLISGDKDFANILHRLRMNNYNVLLATTDHTTGVLCSAATLTWLWIPLVKGEEAQPKLYNYPPDGLSGSWYGYYKRTLDDPFADLEYVPTSQPDENMEQLNEVKPRAIPQTVIDGIRQVLRLYPEGINLSDFRRELRKNNIFLDKDLYGFKKFSLLLCSLPSVVKIIPSPEVGGQVTIVVASGSQKVTVEDVDQPPKSVMENINATESNISIPSHSDQPIQEAASSGLSEIPSKEEKSLSSEESPQLDNQDSLSRSSSRTEEQDTGKHKTGVLREFWRKLIGSKAARSDATITPQIATLGSSNGPPNCQHVQDSTTIEKVDTSVKSTGKFTANCGDSSSASAHLASDPAASTSNLTQDVSDASLIKVTDVNKKSSSHASFGLFGRIGKWWNFGSSDYIRDDTRTDINASIPKDSLLDPHQTKHVLFSKSLFWDALEQFLLAHKGSDLILKSRTREDLILGLQKDGPWLLKDLKQTDFEQLIDVLISEKKWIEETSGNSPFKLKLLPKRPCGPSHSNGLSSIVASKTVNNDGESKRKRRNREEILAHCHKLLKELFVQYPDGFNLSIFRPSFVQKYGYDLDLKMLGYPKLVSLLQIIPGIRIESSLIIPDEKFLHGSKSVNKEPQLTDSSTKLGSNNGDDLWEELGPLSTTDKSKESCDVDSISDLDLSESDSEVSYNEPNQRNFKREESSLLQVLDSWYSAKDENIREQSQSVDGMVDSFRRHAADSGKTKDRPLQQCKQYSFVANSGDDEKEKLFGSILGSLKNSERRISS